MPRISKKGGQAAAVVSAPKERIWNCAVYARLSVEDSGRKGADTIETQIELVASYVNQRSDLSPTGTYIDNGVSGKDFDRPAWLELMEDIRAGRIDCIAVKDLSRFSRNYIETCEFLEKIFPFMGVRFLSVNDGYDSNAEGSHNEGLIIALKALVHDQHIKDISRKIHGSIQARRERGEYTRGYAPFGYQKVKGQKGKLEPDPVTAPIVRKIFVWRASGMSHLAICKELDENGVPTPNEYIRRKNGAFQGEFFKSTIWRAQTLKGILANVAYIGALQQGTQVQRLYAHQPCVDIPRDQWLITENVHEPIIERALFDKIQAIEAATRKAYEASGKRPERPPNVFKGYTICGVCGSKMSRAYSSKKMIHADPWERYYFTCPIGRQHKSSEDAVAREFRSIPEDVLVDAVFPLAAEELRKAANLAAIIEKRTKRQSNPRALLDKEITRISRELETISQRIGKLYEDYVDKLLDEREYVAMKAKYEGRAESLRQNIDSLSERAAVVADVNASNNHWLKAVRDFQNPEKLTREMLEAIVDRVLIFSPDRVKVCWKFGDELKMLEDIVNAGDIGNTEEEEDGLYGSSDSDGVQCAHIKKQDGNQAGHRAVS
jgi:DNA invertase Pin-like site-specific DNA recombinase